jgi:hypothetical protein
MNRMLKFGIIGNVLLGCLVMARPTQAQWPTMEGLAAWQDITRSAADLEVTPVAALEGDIRLNMRLNGQWSQKIGNDGNWEDVLVPDSWTSNGAPHHRWLARRFEMPREFADKQCLLEFQAVRMYAEVFLNGQKIGSHAGAYTPFTLDATAAARPGEVNTLLVYVKDESYALDGDKLLHQVAVTGLIPPKSPLYARGGIWQDVVLRGVNPVHVSDVYIKTSTRNQTLQAIITLRNDGASTQSVTVNSEILPWPASDPDELSLTAQQATLAPGAEQTVELTQSWSEAKLWSPEHPYLYLFRTTLNDDGDVSDTRFGFREFWIDGPDFYLNGTKVRLRGNSHLDLHTNDPMQWRDDFAHRYLQVLKDQLGLNSFRVHNAIGAPSIFKAADEIGLLLIDQSSVWSRGKSYYRRGGQDFLDNTKAEFAEWIKRDRNHPSVVLWDAENEMIRNDMKDWDWTRQLDGFIRPHDDTRPIIHSGAGGCNEEQTVYHVHHHENYTAVYDAWQQRNDKPLIAGEYWVGGRNGERRLISGEEFTDYPDYLQKMATLYKTQMDEQRVRGIAGIMPFNWLFGWGGQFFEPLEGQPEIAWPDVTDQGPNPKTAPAYLRLQQWNLSGPEYRLNEDFAKAFRAGLSPIHVGFRENAGNYFSKETLEKHIVVSNDSEKPQQLTLNWSLRQNLDIIEQERLSEKVQPGEQWVIPLEFKLPGKGTPEHMTLSATVMQSGRIQAQDDVALTIYPERARRAPDMRRSLGVFDPVGSLSGVLENLKGSVVKLENLSALEGIEALVLGEGIPENTLTASGDVLRQFVRAGGRLLALRQETAPDWLAAPLDLYVTQDLTSLNDFNIFAQEGQKAVYQSRYAVVHSPGHPALRSIPDPMLKWWRAGDGRLADDILLRRKSADQTVNMNMRSILGGSRREYSSLYEIMPGDGVAVLCQLHLADNYGVDPAATQLLHNLLIYLQQDRPVDAEQQVAAAGFADLGGLTRWVTDLGELEDQSLPRYAAVLVGPGQIMNKEIEQRLYDYARKGGVVMLTPGAKLPRPVKDNVLVSTPEETPSICMVMQGSPRISGFNSWDFEHWSLPPAAGVMNVREGANIGGVLTVGNVRHTSSGSGRQLDHENYKHLGFGLVEFRVEKGAYIVSQIPIPEAGNYQGLAVYSALWTNFGAKVGE